MDLFDIVGPVMIGPSSSHTAGAARIGLAARWILGERVVEAHIGFHGSFARTHQGHGTDRAILSGLMGMAIDDPRMRDGIRLAQESGMKVETHAVQLRGAHPNTVQLELIGENGHTLQMEAASIGGGNIRITRLDGLDVDFTGEENTVIIHHQDIPGTIAVVSTIMARDRLNIGTMQVYRRKDGGEAVMILELDAEPALETLKGIEGQRGIVSVQFLRKRGV